MNKRENIISYVHLGPVCYVRHAKAKRLGIRINPRGEVRVTIPGRMGLRKAESFVMAKTDWILSKKEVMKTRQDKLPCLKEGDFLHIRGWDVPLLRARESESLEEALWRILLREAKGYLPGRVEELAARHGFNYSGLKIRRMTSRWGSCTTGNSINLNSWLMMLPEHLSDYIILHELAHTIQKNHGNSFWALMDQVTDKKAYSLRKELASYPIMGFRFNIPRK